MRRHCIELCVFGLNNGSVVKYLELENTFLAQSKSFPAYILTSEFFNIGISWC